MMLTSRFEMWLGWGPDLAFFYNDAYIPTLGEKHGRALGLPMREVWSEVYAAVEDRLQSVRRGTPTWDQALMLLLERHGYKEETYHTFSYSPLMSNGGTVEGLFCVVTEETERVISERWLATTRTLATSLLYSSTRDTVLEARTFSTTHQYARFSVSRHPAVWDHRSRAGFRRYLLATGKRCEGAIGNALTRWAHFTTAERRVGPAAAISSHCAYPQK